MSQQPDEPATPAPEEESGEYLPLIELETLLERQPSRRKRLVQISLVLAALVVIFVTFRGSILPQTPSASIILVQPSESPLTVNLISNVNYGALTIDGQPRRGAPPLTMKMRGQPPYNITLNAPPFQPLTCAFPPPATRAPYIFNPCNAWQTYIPNQQAMTQLEMLFTLADLPAAQRQQIIGLFAGGFSIQSAIPVPAQSAIIASFNQDGTITSTRMSGPLEASVSLVPGTQSDQRGLFCFSYTCVGLSAFSSNPSASGQLWGVSTPVSLRWRFTTPSGQVVSDVTFPTSPMLLRVFLSYNKTTGWQIAPLSSSTLSLKNQMTQLICSTGIQMLGIERARFLSGQGWDMAPLHDQGVQGCELELTQNSSDEGHFLWRFGALLAADAKAHSILPMLPVASPDELAAVTG
jgi:hypothetical protein